MGCRSIARINSLVFTNNLVSLTYGVCAMASGRDWTWRSAKNGFRIDHAFGNQAFLHRYPNFHCEIDHEPRLARLTDHSAIIVDFE
jgi:hypothetical protein